MKILPKRLNLTARMMISTLGSILVMSFLTLLLIAYSSSQQEKKSGIELTILKSKEAAHNAEVYLNQASEALNNLSVTYSSLKSGNNPGRETLKNVFLESLKKNKTYMAGWQMWEPNAFDGKDNVYMNDPIYKSSNGAINFIYYLSGQEYSIKKGALSNYEKESYLIPKNDMTLSILEPHMQSYSEKTDDSTYVTSLIMPIIKNDKFLGVLGLDINLDSISNIFRVDSLDSKGFSTLITNDLLIASNPDGKLKTQNLSALINGDLTQIKDSIQHGKMFYNIDVSKITGKKVLRCFSPVKIGNSKKPWSLMFEIPMSEISIGIVQTIIKMASIGIIAILLLSLIIYIISQNIVKHIRKSADFAKEIASGNLDAELDINDRNDEIGEMTIAQRDMVNKLKEIVENVRSNAVNIFSASQQLNSTATDLSQGANEQAASTEEVSASMEQMAANIDQNSVNANQTEQIAAQAALGIEQVSNAVLTTVEAMKKIAEKISIVGVIAEKTDLLAINAAIEAARAGEHGLGFTVVASEIRKLAERSQDAARQIEELTKTSVLSADKSGSELIKIVPDIKKTSILVQEIYAASIEQKAGADQINNAISQLNAVTQRNAAASEEMSASSEELYAQAEQLKEIIEFYKINDQNTKNKQTINRKTETTISNQKKSKDFIGDSINLENDADNRFEKF